VLVRKCCSELIACMAQLNHLRSMISYVACGIVHRHSGGDKNNKLSIGYCWNSRLMLPTTVQCMLGGPTLGRGYSPHSSTALDRECYLFTASKDTCMHYTLVQRTEFWVQLQTRLQIPMHLHKI